MNIYTNRFHLQVFLVVDEWCHGSLLYGNYDLRKALMHCKTFLNKIGWYNIQAEIIFQDFHGTRDYLNIFLHLL